MNTENTTKKAAFENLVAAGYDAHLRNDGIEVCGENWRAFYADAGQDSNEYEGDVPDEVEKLAVWDDPAARGE